MLLIGSKPIEHIYIDTSRVKYIFIGKNQVYSAELQVTYKQNDDGTLMITGLADEYKDIDVLYIPSQIGNKSVTSIGDNAFYNCSSLTSVVIPNSVTLIGYQSFSGCTSLMGVEMGNSITSIGSYAFADCTSLMKVIIPDSVISIGSYAFADCASLTNITVSDENTAYKSIDGNLYSIDGKTLIQYAVGKTDTSVIIPDGVTAIGCAAFFYCTSLTSIVIPDGVTTIGDMAFAFCNSLTSVVIPDSVTEIGYYAFCWCTNLTSIKYLGTEEEWNAITKGYDWDQDTGNYTIEYLGN